jgi:hypothetical protein
LNGVKSNQGLKVVKLAWAGDSSLPCKIQKPTEKFSFHCAARLALHKEVAACNCRTPSHEVVTADQLGYS